MRSERGKNAIALTAFLVAGALLVFGAWRATGSQFLVRDCSFDGTSWAEGRAIGHAGNRYEAMDSMAEDVVKCDDLVYGKTPPEVRDLLGPPDRVFGARRSWYYDIGIPPPNSDYPGLVLEYGREGSVASAAIPGFYEN